jgi:hypothetical protein
MVLDFQITILKGRMQWKVCERIVLWKNIIFNQLDGYFLYPKKWMKNNFRYA